jgi:hypothetical protein
VERVCRLFQKRFPKLVACLLEAEDGVLAYYGFPAEHRRQIWSANSLERLNNEVSRRCDVVGIFPNRQSLLCLLGAVLRSRTTSGPVGRRYFSSESMDKLTQPFNRGGGGDTARAGERVTCRPCWIRKDGFTAARAKWPLQALSLFAIQVAMR